MNTEIELNDKQQAIVNIAERLFASQGIDGTSVRDIANAAGVNVAMISYYFGSKDKLMQMVFEQRSKVLTAKIDTILNNTALTNLGKVEAIIDDYMDKFISQQEFHKIMMREQLLEKNNVIADIILNVKKRNHERLKKLIQDGQKAGEFKKGIDVVLLMATLVGTINNIMSSKRFYQEVHNLQHLSEDEYNKHIKKKLGVYLKNLFKTTLTNDIQ